MKLGQKLFSVLIDFDTGKCEMETWIVRTIRGEKITAVCKNSFTWVKLSDKNFDWGWAKTIDTTWRNTWGYGKAPPELKTTKRLAWKAIKDRAEMYKKSCRFMEEDICNTVIQTARRMIRKE